jgi:chorismate dehydratase
MIRISAVSYLNTKPFIHGIRLAALPDIELSLDMPSEVARKLIAVEVDLGLVPVAVIPLMKEAHILPGFCIGADGAVLSVKLYSQVPLNEIKTIVCDYQSRTSVMLARVLAKESWKIAPEWKAAEPGFEQQIAGSTAAVVIGDRTFAMNGNFAYEFDLAEEWKKLTELPFVFACWVSNKKLPDDFVARFGAALELGLKNISDVIEMEKLNYPGFDVGFYLEHALKLRLGSGGEQGLKLFLEKLRRFSA